MVNNPCNSSNHPAVTLTTIFCSEKPENEAAYRTDILVKHYLVRWRSKCNANFRLGLGSVVHVVRVLFRTCSYS